MTQKELDAGTAAVRAALDTAGYSSYVSDEQCERLAYDVILAAAKVRDSHIKASGEKQG